MNVQKIRVYVVKDGKLLVFRHIDFPYEETGLQVPGGSIADGEKPEEAALRELKEETGRDEFTIVSYLGTDTYDLTPTRAEVQERHFFLAEPTAALPERWESAETHDGMHPPTRLECFWIPLAHGHVLAGGQGALLGKLM